LKAGRDLPRQRGEAEDEPGMGAGLHATGPQAGGSPRAHSRHSFCRQGRETTQGLGKTNLAIGCSDLVLRSGAPRLRSGAPRPKEGIQTWEKDVSEDRDLRVNTPLSSPPDGTGKEKNPKGEES